MSGILSHSTVLTAGKRCVILVQTADRWKVALAIWTGDNISGPMGEVSAPPAVILRNVHVLCCHM